MILGGKHELDSSVNIENSFYVMTMQMVGYQLTLYIPKKNKGPSITLKKMI